MFRFASATPSGSRRARSSPSSQRCRPRRRARAARARPRRGAAGDRKHALARRTARRARGGPRRRAARTASASGQATSASSSASLTRGRSVASTSTRSPRAASSAPTTPRSAQAGPRGSGTRRPGSVGRGIAADEQHLLEEPCQTARPGGWRPRCPPAGRAPCRGPGACRSRPSAGRPRSSPAAPRAPRPRASEARLGRVEEALVEHLDVGAVARGRARVSSRRKDQEPARERHRAQRARALRAGAARDHLVPAALERDAHEVQPSGRLLEALGERRAHERAEPDPDGRSA